MATDQRGRNIVIIGGGIIGSTTAYFLSHHPSFNPQKDHITLLEATKIAGGASGKAGGLLALWAYPECIVPLSYQLHRDLAEKHGGAERWGYRALHCGEVEARGVLAESKDVDDDDNDDASDATTLPKRTPNAISLLRAAGVPQDLDWLAASGLKRYEEMGTPLTTAQVHPYEFTTSMAQLAQDKGVQIVYGSATSIEEQHDDHNHGAVTAVTYTPQGPRKTPHRIPADTVILAAGPWTKALSPNAPISAQRAHSILLQPSRPISAHALFTSIEIPHTTLSPSHTIPSPPTTTTTTVTPEIYPRPNNQVYACGSTDKRTPLPPSSDLVQCDDAACEAIFQHVASISAPLRNGRVIARQACYLPNVDVRSGGGGPLVGPTRVRGLFMAAGHTCWGIQNAPATGKILAEFVYDGEAKSARVGGLDPRKYGV